MADSQLSDSELDFQDPRWSRVVYKDGDRISRHRTMREAIQSQGGFCCWCWTADGLRFDPGNPDEYEVRMERSLNLLGRATAHLCNWLVMAVDWARSARSPRRRL